MDSVVLARWQFAITTVYHFFFVPVTIGLSGLVAAFQTRWLISTRGGHREGDVRWLRLTRYFGKLFLINFAIGVATGIVQEFQFGMNWSSYSRFVGDIFGAPLAIEGLAAFFLESTFLGLWIFGWNRLPRPVHLATIWLAAIGSVLSAIFILAANSWMQHPVGAVVNAARGRAELVDFTAVLTNPVALVTVPHQLFACYMVAGAFVAAVAGWQVAKLRRADPEVSLLRRGDVPVAEAVRPWRSAIRVGAAVLVIAGLGVAVSGDVQGKVMTDVQPMKMAAAEALWHAEAPASFSIFTIGTLDGQHEVFSIKIPYLLSFLATGHFDANVQGIDDLQAAYVQTYGPGTYSPNIPLAYWTFRLMIGTGMVSVAGGLAAWWMSRRIRHPERLRHATRGLARLLAPEVSRGRWWTWAMVALPLLPLVANSFGWIFTETGRQPWLVFGMLRTADGVSPNVSALDVAISMSVFTLLYGILAVVETRLMLRYISAGLPSADPPEIVPDAPLTFAY